MRRLWFFLFSISLVIFDQLSKKMVESHLALYDSIAVIPGFFDLIHIRNTGSAFSLFAGHNSIWIPRLLIAITSISLVAILYFVVRFPQISLILQAGLFSVLGGAAGNLIDRIRYGYVVDFLDIYAGSYHWPAFNVADSAISVGIGLILLDQWRQKPAA